MLNKQSRDMGMKVNFLGNHLNCICYSSVLPVPVNLKLIHVFLFFFIFQSGYSAASLPRLISLNHGAYVCTTIICFN